MQLLDLPTEILYLIVSQSVPTSYEGIVLTCKTLFTVGRPLRSEYNYLRGHRNVAYVPLRNHEARRRHKVHIVASPLDLLFEICRTPRLRHAVEVVSFEKGVSGRLPPGNYTWRDRDYDALRTLLEEYEYLWSRAGYDAPQLMERLFSTDPSGKVYACALAETVLVALLSELKAIVLCPDWAADPLEDGLNLRLITALVRQTNETQIRELVNLRELLTSRYPSSGSMFSLSSVPPHLALQTLDTAKLTRCHWGDRESTVQSSMALFSDGLSGLKKLELETSAMDKNGITKLVSHLNHLEVLVLNLEEDDGAAKKVCWDVGRLIPELGKTVGKTLRSLSIRTPDLPERLWSSVNSFRSFESLRELEMDLNIFHQHDVGAAGSDVIAEGGSAAGPSTSVGDLGDVPRLIDILPASLEKLRLRVKMKTPYRFGSIRCAPTLRRLFEDFKTGLENRLSGLKTVELWQTEVGEIPRGSEAETEELEFAVREITWGRSRVQLVIEPSFKINVVEHDWLVADELR